MISIRRHLSNGHLSMATDEFWVFGYGSLIWKVDFPIECQQTGYIKGYIRRFYQNSIDHRGTPEKPGRVVTLLPSNNPDDKVFGIAYKIPDEKRTEVIKHLDFREKNGYEKHTITFYPHRHGDQPSRDIVIYVATKDNASFAGHINDIEEISKQVYEAHGPSGPNREYVLNLANAMRHWFPNERDDHLFDLETSVKRRIQQGNDSANS